jgi:FAD/FMN-containing dehydrogenase
MKRRDLLKSAMAIPLAGMIPDLAAGASTSRAARLGARAPRSRVRPGEAGWPSATEWDRLKNQVGGRLIKPVSPFAGCGASASDEACAEALEHICNPYFIGDHVALTQTSGYADAWTSQPSAYAIAAASTADVVAAVNFAREHNLRLVVKGGGHSYQGTSNAPDSLLVWTRQMNRVTVHEAFVAQGCDRAQEPQPAVSVQSGAMWNDAYIAVSAKAGRYVQGGGCLSVGVAGLVQSGGFGSFSKNYGTAAAGLLEAEVVTADGEVRIVNACTNPDLHWGLKGGGGGSLGVVTRLTLRTRELPEYFGAVLGQIKASSDEAFRALLAQMVALYQRDLFNPHWGETLAARRDNVLELSMVFQGLTQQQAQAIWAPFLAWVRARPEYTIVGDLYIIAMPAKSFWDPDYYRKNLPGVRVDDDRPGASRDHTVWAGDRGQVGWFIHDYKSAWLPATLLGEKEQARLVDALFEGSRHWSVGLHFNKGLAGAPPEAIAAARDTATNPQVLDAFALAIISTGGGPAFPGMPGPGVDMDRAHANASRVGQSMEALLKVAPGAGAYVSESDYRQPDWQTAFWGTNYRRLAAVKRKYDPQGLFFVHHGVGSEAWSADGFTRV